MLVQAQHIIVLDAARAFVVAVYNVCRCRRVWHAACQQDYSTTSRCKHCNCLQDQDAAAALHPHNKVLHNSGTSCRTDTQQHLCTHLNAPLALHMVGLNCLADRLPSCRQGARATKVSHGPGRLLVGCLHWLLPCLAHSCRPASSCCEGLPRAAEPHGRTVQANHGQVRTSQPASSHQAEAEQDHPGYSHRLSGPGWARLPQPAGLCAGKRLAPAALEGFGCQLRPVQLSVFIPGRTRTFELLPLRLSLVAQGSHGASCRLRLQQGCALSAVCTSALLRGMATSLPAVALRHRSPADCALCWRCSRMLLQSLLQSQPGAICRQQAANQAPPIGWEQCSCCLGEVPLHSQGNCNDLGTWDRGKPQR